MTQRVALVLGLLVAAAAVDTERGATRETAAQKDKAIKEANEKIEVLQADIEKYKAEAENLGKEVATLDGDISTWEGDVKASTKVREIENNDYTATHKDYSESITALEEGVETLRKQNHDVGQASAALLQVSTQALVTPEAKHAIQRFLASDPSLKDENLAVAAPEANAFESQLQGIIDMLSGLATKFDKERTTLEKQEEDAKHAYDMLSMDLKNSIDAATESRTEKSEKKGAALQAAADAEVDLADTSTTRDDDAKFLADTIATCELKSSAFADRQTLRQEEIEAIGKAKEIIGSGAVAGASEKHLPQLIQQGAAAFVQLRSDAAPTSQLRVAAYLHEEGRRINSRVLKLLATRVMADPFKKVKKMIKDLVIKLMEEATEEAETKGFCDTEMSTNEHTRKEKTSQVEMLTADIDELSASVATLSEEVAELTAAIADLDASVKKASDIRMAEKKKNKQTIKDAQEAVAAALGVLKEFYDKAGKATALVQQPEIFDDAPYKGMGGQSGGVVGMIEVIQSDFERLEAETTSNEEAAAKEFKQFMNDSRMDKMQKSKDVEHKSEKKAEQEESLQEKKADLAGTQKELDAALAYYEKLKPTCVSGGAESFEDRVAQRKEEIESLQEALRILNGEDIALLQMQK